MLARLPLGRSAFSSTLPILPLGRFPNRGLASAESGRYDGRMFLPTFFSIFCYKQQYGCEDNTQENEREQNTRLVYEVPQVMW